MDYLKRVIATIQSDGSACLEGDFGRASFNVASRFRFDLFKQLDDDWQRLAQRAGSGNIGLSVPPVLSIVLSRAACREAIPEIITDLRYEWCDFRNRIWALLNQFKTISNPAEGFEIEQQLTSVSQIFSPGQSIVTSSPFRMIWNVLEGSVTDGKIGAAFSFAPIVLEGSRKFFGRPNLYDLAKKVRHSIEQVDYSSLRRLLSDSEKNQLGL